jgi:hypothetical protein
VKFLIWYIPVQLTAFVLLLQWMAIRDWVVLLVAVFLACQFAACFSRHGKRRVMFQGLATGCLFALLAIWGVTGTHWDAFLLTPVFELVFSKLAPAKMELIREIYEFGTISPQHTRAYHDFLLFSSIARFTLLGAAIGYVGMVRQIFFPRNAHLGGR